QTLTKEDGLSHDHTHSIYGDRDGSIWFGTDHGVSHYQARKFVPVPFQDQLIGATVNAIRRDARGDLWFGTFSHGVYRYDGNSLTQFTTKDGLPANQVGSVFDLPSGELWIGTALGLSRFTGTNFAPVPGLEALTHVGVNAAATASDGSV